MDFIKNRALEVFRRAETTVRSAKKHFLFILQIILWVVVLYFLVPLLSSLAPLFFPSTASMTLGDFILLITAAFILAYTYQTQRLREETVFQRRMSAAHDIRFRMMRPYMQRKAEDVLFALVATEASPNSVCEFYFITAVVGARIGKHGPFRFFNDDSNTMSAYYDISTQDERDAFLKSLRIDGGKIRARVLTTNGERFIYTFRVTTSGWEKVLTSRDPDIKDSFILVKKELDEA